MKTKSALSYFGSDSAVAESIAFKLQDCKHVTIPFVGGASILPYLTARAIVGNDLNGLAICFYKTLSGAYGRIPKAALIERCKSTLSHPGELADAQFYLSQDESFDPCLRAWAYWAICWVGRKGKGGTKQTGGKPSVRWTPEGGTNATRIAAAAQDLEDWAKHFRRCEWTQECFRDVIPKVADQQKCGLYVDAPWVKSGRNYLHSFSDQDHQDLASLLDHFENTVVVIRYDDHELVQQLYPEDCWYWERVESRSQANTSVAEVCISRRAKL